MDCHKYDDFLDNDDFNAVVEDVVYHFKKHNYTKAELNTEDDYPRSLVESKIDDIIQYTNISGQYKYAECMCIDSVVDNVITWARKRWNRIKVDEN